MSPKNDIGEAVGFEPSYSQWNPIRHYYGDPVRQLFLGGAALMLIGSPLYATSLSTQFPFIVAGAVFAVGFAALTSPKTRWVAFADAIIAGVGLTLYAMWAMLGYDDVSPVAFVLRVAISIVFLFAFYFALKTVRGFVLGNIGVRESFNEFSDASQVPEEELEYPGNEEASEQRARKEGRIAEWLREED